MSTLTRNRTSGPTRARVEVAPRGPDVNSFLVGSVGVLCLLGLVMVYSASSVKAVSQGGSGWKDVTTQAGFMLVGAVGGFAASRLPGRFWRGRIVDVLLVTSFVLQAFLAAASMLRRFFGAELPLAIHAKGAARWVGVGPLSFQPSDLAKLALILWLARFISSNQRRMASPDVLKRILFVSGLLCALVMSGNDLGTTILLFGIMVVMLFLGGAPWGMMTMIVITGVLLAVAAVFLIGGFRMDRISAFFDPSSNFDKAYQAQQSKIGLASGGFFGSGLGNSRMKWGYLPEADTDFIFTVVGEELGVVGTLIVLGSYVTFMASCVTIALRSKKNFTRYVAFGVASWIGVQALINIGVALSVLPTKGITLPFVSRGGSSLVMCLIAVGVLVSVSREPA